MSGIVYLESIYASISDGSTVAQPTSDGPVDGGGMAFASTGTSEILASDFSFE